MAYIKNTWVDQDVERPKTYEVTNNQDGSITLTDSFGLVTELGTPVNAVNMNHIEDGVAGCAIRKYNLTETFALGEWVLGGTGDDEGIYKSLIANNVGNAITDDTAWEKVEMGGGATRNIGEIVASTIPLTDAGLHLLDGSLLVYGSYQAFIDYIADLYDSGDYTDIFETEANWQAEVLATGFCNKYVYDSVNNTVRLPKIGNQLIYNIPSTLGVKGNGITLGLTNAGGNFGIDKFASNSSLLGNPNAYNKTVGTSVADAGIQSKTVIGVTSDSSKSGIVAETNNINTADVYYYVVIATSTKTAIQVDIDEIATDLNSKADIDLTNTVPAQSFIDKSVGWGMPDYSAGVSISSGDSAIDNGLVIAIGATSDQQQGNMYVNSVKVGNNWNGAQGGQQGFAYRVFVSKGDVVTWDNTYTSITAKFYPLKGVSNA